MKSPAFSFYVRDWLGSSTVAQMSGNAVKAYVYLLAAAWLQEPRGSLPSKPLALATLARCSKDEWDAISDEVLAAFKPGDATGNPAFSGRIFNERLLEESIKQFAKQRSGSLGGIAKASKPLAPATVLLPSKQGGKSLAALENANEDEKGSEKRGIKGGDGTLPINEAQAVEWASMVGVPADVAIEIYNQCEGRSWVDGADRQITSWAHHVKWRHSQRLREKKEGGKYGNSQRNTAKVNPRVEGTCGGTDWGAVHAKRELARKMAEAGHAPAPDPKANGT